MVPLLTRSMSARSNWVETLKAFDCPGVGARKPVLRLLRREKVSTSRRRAATLPFKVPPNPWKSSKRSAPPTVQASSSP